MCRFCSSHEAFMENETCFAVRGDNSVSFGHTMVTTKRHVESYFHLNYQELEDMNQLVKNVWAHLDKVLEPDGYNIAVNIGKWAGQDTPHATIHIIPRYAGDVPATELKGGIVRLPKGTN